MKRNHRFLATLTALCLLGTLIPASVLATEGEGGHLEACGYVCTHQHDEACGYVEAVEGRDCADVHVHDADCGYSEGAPEVNCPNEGCDGTEDGHVEHRDAVPGTDCGYIHEHSESCGYVEAVEGSPCAHVCTEDEWVCAEGCPAAAANDSEVADESVSTSAELLDIEQSDEAESLELDIANGSVAVTKAEDKLLVVQGGEQYVLTGGALTLTGTMDLGSDMPKSDIVTIGQDVELSLTTKNLTIQGYWARVHIITISKNASVDWTLEGVTTLYGATASAVRLAEDANVTISGDTLTASNSGGDYAVISVPEGADLTVDGAAVSAVGGGAGIGSDTNHYTTPVAEGVRNETTAGTISFINGAEITAQGGYGAAAIGGGEYSNAGTIHIGAGCTVNAAAGDGAAAIGGGTQANYKYQQYGGEVRGGGKAGDITIESGATVIATSGAGSAIGRAVTGDKRTIDDTSGSITIDAGASVTAISLGHDNYTGEHGKPYYFAIDTGIENNISASILNARFDKEALPRIKSTTIKDENGEPIGVIPSYNRILVTGNDVSISLALPAGSPSSAFAVTVPGAGDYMVANAAEGKEAERAEYLLIDGDSQYLFTVGGGMTTRDQLKFASFTITATAGEHGSISDSGVTLVSPLDKKNYSITPDEGYEIDTITVDGKAVDSISEEYMFSGVVSDHSIDVTFKAAEVTPPPVDPPSVTYYHITVNYLNAADGTELVGSYTRRLSENSRYDVTDKAALSIDGYTIDHVDGELKDTVKGDVTVNVYYAAVVDITDPSTPTTDLPPVTEPETPDVTIDEGDVPTAALPEVPAEPENPGETVIVEDEVPLGNLPQTGTMANQADPAVTLGAAALALSLALAGVTALVSRRKEDAE